MRPLILALIIAVLAAGCAVRPSDADSKPYAAVDLPPLNCPVVTGDQDERRQRLPKIKQYASVIPMPDGTLVTETTAFNPIKNRIRATRTAEGECQKKYRRWETVHMEDRGGWIRLRFRCSCPIPGYESMAE